MLKFKPIEDAVGIEALRAGKAVFVEKPMALDEEEMNSIVEAIEETEQISF